MEEDISVVESSSNIDDVVRISSVDVFNVVVSVVNTNLGCIIFGCFGVILLLTFCGVVFLANTMIPPGTSVTVTIDSSDDLNELDFDFVVVEVVEVDDDIVLDVVDVMVVVVAVVVVLIVVVVDGSALVVGREAETVLGRRGGVIRMEGRLLVEICVVS